MREARYTRTAIAFHWLMAVVLVGLFCLGTYMHELPLSPEKLRLYAWHKWAGISAFLLALSRLGWLLAHRPPAWPVSVPRWQEVLARGVHLLLYVLMLAIPLSGWLMSSAKGFPTIYLGILPLPDLVQKDRELADLLQRLHFVLNLCLAALVVVHVAAVLKHRLLDRDEVFGRMLPFRAGKR